MRTLLLLALIPACSSKPVDDASCSAMPCDGSDVDTDTDTDTDADADADTDTDTDTDTAFAPSTGAWSVTDVTLQGDTCGIDASDDTGEDDTGTLMLTQSEDGAYSLNAGAVPVDFRCELDDATLSCADLVFTDDLTSSGTDAIVVTTARFHMAFTGDNTAEIAWAVNFDCSGEECTTVTEAMGLLTTPCSTQYEGRASFSEG